MLLELPRTLATHPRLLLLDELLAGQNPSEVAHPKASPRTGVIDAYLGTDHTEALASIAVA